MRPGSPLQVGRFDTFVRRLFSAKWDSMLPSLAPDIHAEIPLVGDDDAELRALRGELLCSAFTSAITAAAGATPFVLLFNPANSGRLVIVDRAELVLGVTNAWLVGLIVNGTVGSQTAGLVIRDTRYDPATQLPAAEFFTGTTAVVPPGTIAATLRTEMRYMQAGLEHTLRAPVVLSPGFGLFVFMMAPNGQAELGFGSDGGGFLWREREGEPSELAKL